MLVDEVLLSVIKGMEWQKVQGTVRDDHDVWRVDFADERRHQQVVKPSQQEPGGFENLDGMNGQVLRVEREIAQLESQTSLQVENCARRRKLANNFCVVSRD